MTQSKKLKLVVVDQKVLDKREKFYMIFKNEDLRRMIFGFQKVCIQENNNSIVKYVHDGYLNNIFVNELNMLSKKKVFELFGDPCENYKHTTKNQHIKTELYFMGGKVLKYLLNYIKIHYDKEPLINEADRDILMDMISSSVVNDSDNFHKERFCYYNSYSNYNKECNSILIDKAFLIGNYPITKINILLMSIYNKEVNSIIEDRLISISQN